MLVKVPLYIYLKQIAIKSCSDMGPQGVKSFLPTNQGSVVERNIFRKHCAWRNPRYCGGAHALRVSYGAKRQAADATKESNL